MRHQIAEVAFIFWSVFSSVTVIQLLDPFFIGIELFPLHADPVQIEIDLKKKTTDPAIGVVKRVDVDKLLIKFNGVIHGIVCTGDKMGYRTLHLSIDSPWWGSLELLPCSEENNAIFRILSLSIRSCIGEDVLKKVAMENTGQVREESLVFFRSELPEFENKAFCV